MPPINLIIVESPGKIKKIKSIMGADYEIAASVGHIKGMDPKSLGFDIEKNYEPEFIVMSDKKDVVAKLKKAAKGVKNVYFCADADREGEMIAYSVMTELKIPVEEAKRASFTEITKKAISNAIANPGRINMDLVHAQMSRSVLDKLIGYKVSPVLWKQFGNFHLSAGRVQSVVAKLIIERENEIAAFSSSQYFPLDALFAVGSAIQLDGTCDTTFTTKDAIIEVMNQTAKGGITYTISSITESLTERKPAPPYITSSLQQDASNKLGMNPETCMRIAQQLYEAGFITYMRTDSTALSDEIVAEVQSFVIETYGDGYFKKVRYASKAANAQEAHEACRPTHITTTSVMGIEKLTSSHNRLYQMIWRRTVASQMSPAKINVLKVKINGQGYKPSSMGVGSSMGAGSSAGSSSTSSSEVVVAVKPSKKKAISASISNETPLIFSTKFENIVFDGFLAVYAKQKNEIEETGDENEADDTRKCANITYEEVKRILKEGQSTNCVKMQSTEKWSKPPHGRFNEAGLIKKLEDLGIGRPATYAKMVGKVQERSYVEIKTVEPRIVEGASINWSATDGIVEKAIEIKLDGDKNKLFPTSLGVMINNFLDSKFATFMDYQFTAKVEELLDKVAAGEYVWWKVVDSVYQVIKPTILELEASRAASSAEGGKGKKASSRAAYREIGDGINIVMTRNGYALSKMNEATGKYQYANIDPSELDTITLEEAVKKLSIPRTLGMMDGAEIVLAKAKNIYLKWNGKNYSIENYLKAKEGEVEFEPEETTLENAMSVIRYYTSSDSASAAGGGSNPTKYGDYEVRQGPYGAYIKFGGANYPLPPKYKKNVAALTEDICREIVEKKKTKTEDGESGATSTSGRGRERGRSRGFSRGGASSTRGRGGYRGRGSKK